MKSKFLKFVKTDQLHEHRHIWYVINKRSGDALAQIFYYAPWKQYAARFNPTSIWSEDCLQDIRYFINSGEVNG